MPYSVAPTLLPEVLMRVVEEYESDPASKQLLRVVMCYVDYVNRTVLSK